MSRKRDSVYVWTDGSCKGNPGPGGWAALLIYGENMRLISGWQRETTNNRMEAAALLSSLKALKRGHLDVVINTDSTYVIKCVSAVSHGRLPAANRDIWSDIASVIEEKRLRLLPEKVEAHAYDHINNLVDLMSKTSRSRRISTSEYFTSIDKAHNFIWQLALSQG